jgi:hypothetical protein
MADRKISGGDRVRIAMAPLHVVIGGALIVQFVRGLETDQSTPMVLVLGIAFVAFGIYRLALIRKALRK